MPCWAPSSPSSASGSYYFTLFAGTVTATGVGSVTASWSGTTPGGFYLFGHEFHSSVGSWSLDVQGNLDSAAATNELGEPDPGYQRRAVFRVWFLF